MKHPISRALLVAPLAGLAACLMPPSMYERASFGAPPPPNWQTEGRYRPEGATTTVPAAPAAGPAADEACTDGAPPARPAQAPLYAWDGGVVDGAPQGRVTEQQGAPRGVETPPQGRAHIIELYQQALDQRDALADEVERLRAALDLTTLSLEQRTRDGEDLAARVATLEEAHRALQEEHRALAGRLAQAQIRRLEAEKLLLETRIDRERARAAEAARLPSGTPPRPGAAPAATSTGAAPAATSTTTGSNP